MAIIPQISYYIKNVHLKLKMSESLFNLYRKFTWDIGILVLTDAATAVKGLLVLPAITKLLGASAYGIWIQSMVTVTLVAVFCDLNLSGALARFLAAEKDKGKIQEGFYTVAFFSIILGSAVSILMVLLRNPIAEILFHDRNLALVVLIIALTIPLYELNAVAVGFYRALREIKTYSWFIIAREMGGLVILVPLVLRGAGVYGALISVLAAYFLVNAVMFYLIVRRIGLKFPRFTALRPYLKFSLPTIPNGLSSWFVSSGDRYVIAFILGTASVGIYSASYGLGSGVAYFSAPLAFILIPTLSRLYDERRMNEVKTHLSYSLKYFLMFAIPAVFGLSLLAKTLLNILTTVEFVGVGPVVVPLIATGYLFWGVYIIFSQVFVLLKRVNIVGIQWLIAAGLNLALNIAFVPVLGVIGAAITTSAVYFLIAAWLVVLSRARLTFPVDWRFIAKSLAASIVMSAVVWALHPDSISEVVMAIAVGVTIYFGLLFAMRAFSHGEIDFFRRLVRFR